MPCHRPIASHFSLRQLACALATAGLVALLPPARAADAHGDDAKPAAKKSGDAKPAAGPAKAEAKGLDEAAAKGGKARKGPVPKPVDDDEEDEEPPPKASAKRGTKAARDGDDAVPRGSRVAKDGDSALAKGGRAAKDASDTPARKDAKEGREREDPIDRLRERLAERLGSAKAIDPHVMRVTAQAPAPSAAAKTAQAAAGRAAAKRPAANRCRMISPLMRHERPKWMSAPRHAAGRLLPKGAGSDPKDREGQSRRGRTVSDARCPSRASNR